MISLRAVVEEMGLGSDEVQGYLNRRTGELITMSTEMISAAEEGEDLDEESLDWEVEEWAKAQEIVASDDFLPLPDRSDINEYHIMEEFCEAVADRHVGEILAWCIRGSGAFRRFKDAIHHHGVAEDWYRFRDQAMARIAAAWLDENGIAYQSDLGSRGESV